MKPKPGDMQHLYLSLGRIDLARGPQGWWVTVWACRPPPRTSGYIAKAETWWWGRVRVLRRIECVR